MEKTASVTQNPLYEAADGDSQKVEEPRGTVAALKDWVRGCGVGSRTRCTPVEAPQDRTDVERAETTSSEGEHSFPFGVAVTFKVRSGEPHGGSHPSTGL
jgi:hypothetical protein